jgi:hypothetical protein
VAVVSAGIGLVVAGGAGAVALLPTKGPIPVSSSGVIDWGKVPDFIKVTDGNATVGYAPRSYLIGNAPGSQQPSNLGVHEIPIYKSDLKTLVGHLYPGVGFVPLGKAWWSVACAPEPNASDEPPGTVPCPSVLLTLPSVMGMSTPAAAAKVSALGFDVDVVNVPVTSGALGVIVGMSPNPGPSVHARSIVILENSVPMGDQAPGSGTSEAVTVPSVIGESEAQAVAALRAIGLRASVSTQQSATVQVGVVISQTPVAASKVLRGSQVELRVSGGQ